MLGSVEDRFGFRGSILLLRQLDDLYRLAHAGHKAQREQNDAQPWLRPELLIEEFPEEVSDDWRQRENERNRRKQCDLSPGRDLFRIHFGHTGPPRLKPRGAGRAPGANPDQQRKSRRRLRAWEATGRGLKGQWEKGPARRGQRPQAWLRAVSCRPQVHGGTPLRLLGFTTPRPRLRSALPQTEDAPPFFPLSTPSILVSNGPAVGCLVR